MVLQTTRTIRIRHKGQITLPAEIRQDLGLHEGDDLIVQRRGREIILAPSSDVVARTAGVFKDYAYTRNPDVNEEKAWIVQHIAETADCYDE